MSVGAAPPFDAAPFDAPLDFTVLRMTVATLPYSAVSNSASMTLCYSLHSGVLKATIEQARTLPTRGAETCAWNAEALPTKEDVIAAISGMFLPDSASVVVRSDSRNAF